MNINNMTIKYLSFAALALAMSATVASCSREEDDIWEQSAIERLEAAQGEYYDVLCAAPNGWEMLYFAGSGEQGYNFLMKFEQGDKVTIATRNPDTGDAYAEETSAFDVIIDDGPVLTFNTDNTLFHRYSDPDPDHTQDTDGVGSGGDYEFKIMSACDTMVYMRGKKRGIEIYMYPLASDDNWEKYFDDIYAMRDSMFNPSIPTLWLTLADGVRYSISNAASQVMSFVPEGGDAVTQTSTMNYVVTRRGFRWMNSFPGDTITTTPAREFVMNAEGTYLVSTDFGGDDCTAGATIKAPALSEFFMQQGTTWRVDDENLGGQFATAYQNLATGFSAVSGSWRLTYMEFSYNASGNSFALSIRNNRSTGVIYCSKDANGDNNIRLNFSGEGDSNGSAFIEYVPQLVEFMNLLSSSDLVGATELDPVRIRVENSANANDYFYVDLQ